MVEKPMLTEYDDGNIHISWDSFTLRNSFQSSNLRVSYDISITNDAGNEDCSEFLVISDSSHLSHDFNPRLLNQCDSHGQCLSFNVTIVPIINNEVSGEKTTLLTGIY